MWSPQRCGTDRLWNLSSAKNVQFINVLYRNLHHPSGSGLHEAPKGVACY